MKLIRYLFFFAFATGYSQTVLVDNTSNSPNELAQILMDNTCAQVSNVSVSSTQAVAYFNNQGGTFPISEGVIIRSGSAKFSEGTYTGNNMSSQLNGNGDPFLQQLNASSGQSTLITDVAFLQFDFVPLSANFNFKFLFASNEYGQWQCLSSDAFAFLLTDLTTGTTTNLALVPGTNLPISVKNIKDNAYNPSCGSDNPNLFSTYNVNNPNATINMRGHTVVMTASTIITAGNPYQIRLVIGDSNDANFDSAIFLTAGSFNTNLNLGPDRVICDGDTRILQTGLDTSLYAHTWFLNGTVIPGETGNSLTVSQSGTYSVSVTKNNSSCLITDEVVFSDLMVQNPEDLMVCHNQTGNYTYDLTANNEATLGINNAVYDLFYYASQTDLTAQNPIPTANLTAYASSGNQTVYLKIKNKQTGNFCNAVYNFDLLINAPINLGVPNPIEVCATANPIVDLTSVVPELLNGQNPSLYNFTFFGSQSDAQQNTNTIADPTAYAVQTSASSTTIWVRAEDTQKPECFAVTSFTIIVNPLPIVDDLPDVIECSQYVLPNLNNGNYYTQTNGTGQQLIAGDIIDESSVIFIFTGPDANGCTNQSSFEVTLIDEYDISGTYCGKFTLPVPDAGAFYTAPGGPSGTGTELLPGTVITTTQTIYFYVEINGVFCQDKPFVITILNLPPIDTPSDVVTCTQYILPVLNNGTYFPQPGGNGVPLAPGDVITVSQDLYVFNDDGTCTNQHKFRVTIIPDFADVNACGSYVLPQLEIGGYYTQATGQGQQIAEGTTITTSQTLYVYATTTTMPNCTDNLSFVITIIPIPPVDALGDVLLCEDEGGFLLPTLTNGDYFTAPNRQGSQLFPGDTITTTQTIYINNLVNGCDNESDFFVEIRPLPKVEDFTDIYSCEPFKLPELTHGTFYTATLGGGSELPAGTLIDSTQTLYIYNDHDDLTTCYSENAFTIYINGVEVGNFNDVVACDQYVLPPLTVGNYFDQSGGEGTPFFAGDTLTTSQEVFVYAEKGVRFTCTDETSFQVSISETPVLPDFSNIEKCGTYTLPALPQENYNIGYFWEPNGQNEIPPSEYTFSVPGEYLVYVYAVSPTNPDCFDQDFFKLTIYPLLELNIEGGTICKDPETGEVLSPVILSSGLDPTEFTVNWFLNGNVVYSGPEFTATEAGTYTVKSLKLSPENGANCNYAPTQVLVLESAKPIVQATVSQPFSDVATITVEIINGVGEYEYQLDNGAFQGSNVFHDVESGTHIVHVRGINGNCGETSLKVEVFKYPKFFTPNSDGFNDRWNIVDLRGHPEATIKIFDRYGKLLTTFRPFSNGWDGTYNGRRMPSNDYWFLVEFEMDGQKKTFRSHFTLKR